MADVNVNQTDTNALLRPSKLDTFNDFYSQMMEQQKAAEALYKLAGVEASTPNSYEEKYRGKYTGSSVPIAKRNENAH